MKNKILVMLLCLLWFAFGCVYTKKANELLPATKIITTYFSTPSSVLIYSDSLKYYASMWSIEAHRKYPNSIVVLSHGKDIDGLWWCEYPDHDNKRLVSELVDQVRIKYPLRRIVLMICNPGGYKLEAVNISYSLTNIWVIPDRELNIRSWTYPDTIGNIYEMQEN